MKKVSRSQEFTNTPQNLLNAAGKAAETGKVVENTANAELSHRNTNQQFRKELMEEAAYTAYDAANNHKTYQSSQRAYNEVRQQYEEQAFAAAGERAFSVEQDPSVDPPPAPSVQSVSDGQQRTYEDLSSAGSGVETGGMIGGTEWKSPSMVEVGSRAASSGTFGTAETPKLWANTQALSENEELIQKLEGKRKDVQKVYTRFSLGEHSTEEKLKSRYYGRLDLTGEMDYAKFGRLKYSGRVVREKMTRDDYGKLLSKQSKAGFRRRTTGRLLFRGVKTVAEDGSLSEDDVTGSMKRGIRRTGRVAMASARKNVRTIKYHNNVYNRLTLAEERNRVLLDKRERLISDGKKKQEKAAIRAAKSREQKKKLKKQMVQRRAIEEGNFFTRLRQNRLVKRRAKKLRQQTVKRTLSTVFSLCGLAFFFLLLGIILFLILVAVFTGGAEYYASAVTQNDYSTITDATEYYRKLETDLDEYLNADRDALEAELEAEYGPDIYEFVYDLAEFGFSANTLIAYLSAVYGTFTLESVQEELDAIFEEMYTLTIEVKVEDREVTEYDPATDAYETTTKPKKICYVTLTKKELEEVVEARMSAEESEQYKIYHLSTGGQQIYGPVMQEDWTSLISSNFGERIHPITKERKSHNGVDIAVPIGTHVYSAIEGTVILAAYSETAGNWVKVQNEEGWTVVMMHMDSLTVSQGQQVKRGDHLGYSGNTGRSTGPHLHLEVRNPSDQPMNPIFIIPQTCAQLQGGTE